ncbi:methanogenesis marker protein 17 [Methanohalobium evestigatum Z-7303]|uniref:Methanogenesis marker protein 17 n=1 Tax=Methanohalobium evestigatum (strain ATCC BAA-1072 / DSM 3721 / NBRC 107634 / OCM 161 / Z-7303) TaxID=644295 RepID=D7EBD7_METEZ|nr:methanogenesis marker 17 protein [Methanohalobium evestigatum]ADI74654.1 methanogenesis marker protein 17 [Methanohalobium evestigatum Z-7303]
MEPLETFVVEAPQQSESEQYRQILKDVISDMVLAQSIGRIKVVIRPDESLFQMALVLRGGLSPVKTSDFADVNVGEFGKNEVVIKINNEKYLSQLLKILWDKYGRLNVRQPERKTVAVKTENPMDKISDIEYIIVDDPRNTLKKRVVDMAVRVAPEGFRVRYHSLKGDNFIFVASEDAMKQEWIEEAHQMLDELTDKED